MPDYDRPTVTPDYQRPTVNLRRGGEEGVLDGRPDVS